MILNFFFLLFQKNGSVGRWETKHFIGMALQVKEATFLSVDGCSERSRELSMPGYQLKHSDRSKLNWSIKEMVEKLNVIMKDLKEHDSTLF